MIPRAGPGHVGRIAERSRIGTRGPVNDSPRCPESPRPLALCRIGATEDPSPPTPDTPPEPEARRKRFCAFRRSRPLETGESGELRRNRGRRIAQDRRRRRAEGYGYPRIRGLRLPARVTTS